MILIEAIKLSRFNQAGFFDQWGRFFLAGIDETGWYFYKQNKKNKKLKQSPLNPDWFYKTCWKPIAPK